MDHTDQSQSKVLIIEDEEMLREVYSMAFKLQHIDVALAEDGAQGLEVAEKIMPDIILLDVMMPQMNGVEVLQRLKNNPQTKDIPVAMLSNLAEDKVATQTRKLGAIAYIIKTDYLPKQIVEFVQKQLAHKS